MLRALNRLLVPAGRIALTTITITPDLPASARRRARAAGPRAVASRAEIGDQLARAGFVDIDVVDVTAAFRVTAATWYQEAERHADELSRDAPATFAEKQRDRMAQLQAIDGGLLRRSMASAVRPRR